MVEGVDCRHPDRQFRAMVIDDREARSGRNPYEKYLAREDGFELLTYLEMRQK